MQDNLNYRKKFRVAILANMPIKSYSGGRYHAAILAECLSAAGNDVFFVTNAISSLWNDFKEYPRHGNIKFVLTGNFNVKKPIHLPIDYTIVVPDMNSPDIFYRECRDFCLHYNSKLIIINFETPNWYNSYSKWKKDEEKWNGIKKYLCTQGCLILSSAKESMKYAKKFYGCPNANLFYDVWNPAINSIVADTVTAERGKQIIAMIRFSDKHKGTDELLNIISQPMQGYKVVLVSGNGKISKNYVCMLNRLSHNYHFSYEILKKLTDKDKFYQMKKSSILLFPSYFEGYGYPPVEARYCNTWCLAYDLPVLREINGTGIEYCQYGNSEDMKRKLAECINKQIYIEIQKDNKVENGNINYRIKDIQRIMEKYQNIDWRKKNICKEIVKLKEWRELKYKIKIYIKYFVSTICCFSQKGKQINIMH